MDTESLYSLGLGIEYGDPLGKGIVRGLGVETRLRDAFGARKVINAD